MEDPVGIKRGVDLVEFLERPPFNEVRLHDDLVGFTRRERDVLSLMVRGIPTKLIAEDLEIGERTVETYINKILRKMHLPNQVAVVATLYANRMVILEKSHPDS